MHRLCWRVHSPTVAPMFLTFRDNLGLLTAASGNTCCYTNNYLSGSNKCSCREFKCLLWGDQRRAMVLSLNIHRATLKKQREVQHWGESWFGWDGCPYALIWELFNLEKSVQDIIYALKPTAWGNFVTRSSTCHAKNKLLEKSNSQKQKVHR